MSAELKFTILVQTAEPHVILLSSGVQVQLITLCYNIYGHQNVVLVSSVTSLQTIFESSTSFMFVLYVHAAGCTLKTSVHCGDCFDLMPKQFREMQDNEK